jgi:hypothetical protein
MPLSKSKKLKDLNLLTKIFTFLQLIILSGKEFHTLKVLPAKEYILTSCLA